MGGACKASKSGISLPVYYSFAMSCPWFCGMTSCESVDRAHYRRFDMALPALTRFDQASPRAAV
jgi:hypothetical protein